jgi:hypothetical protein
VPAREAAAPRRAEGKRPGCHSLGAPAPEKRLYDPVDQQRFGREQAACLHERPPPGLGPPCLGAGQEEPDDTVLANRARAVHDQVDAFVASQVRLKKSVHTCVES